jgi:hypothetical protein
VKRERKYFWPEGEKDEEAGKEGRKEKRQRPARKEGAAKRGAFMMALGEREW